MHQTSCHHTPQKKNGIAERKNNLMEVARAIRVQTKVPKHLWVSDYYSYLFNKSSSIMYFEISISH